MFLVNSAGFWYAILVSFLGFAIAFRTSRHLIEQNFFEKSEMTKIGTLYICAFLALLKLLPHTHLSFWIAVFAPLFVVALVLTVLIKRRSLHFRNSLVAVLALISLKMKTGRSFRRALSEVTAESEPRLRVKLSEIGSVVVFSPQKGMPHADPFISSFVSELILIDQQPHAATRRLAVFRDKLRIEDDFRRKSGQVLARIRAQSIIMTGLYVALASFIIWKFGWKTSFHIYLLSAALFSVGLLWMWRGGRNLKWKV